MPPGFGLGIRIPSLMLEFFVVAPKLCYVKTATIRDLRNQYTRILRWISAGEEVLITQRSVEIMRPRRVLGPDS